ncbi:uncharacterized protein HKW66_Vig0146850 [Vigna angularis]|uniref:Neprosin PEP catalytic domain-containing protein n=2 Tax=Phaseolus angularis TaxID=3914 RepID=A0A8T0JY46_PHAAN|nr:uncharacterized protein HKW66_Vig0146850 [Vigna angularis]
MEGVNLKMLGQCHKIEIHMTEFGGIVDCINIYKQPVFDHPLLKNHRLQIKPTFENLTEKTLVNNSQIGSMFDLDNEECPQGTVPVQRMKYNFSAEEKLLNNDILIKDIPGVHVAEAFVPQNHSPFYQVNGICSLYNPKVEKGQISMSHIWVENGPVESSNRITMGWHVHPSMYGDARTHFYTSWTSMLKTLQSDNFKKTGCYNTACRGFVQVDRKNFPGGYFPDTSTYGGATYEAYMAITQDLKTKNWWISAGKVNIGYYPAALFSNLGSASIVGWGGRTKANVGGRSPPMGSGHFPDGDRTHESYFRSPKIQGASLIVYTPESFMTKHFSDNTKCYDVGYHDKYYGEVNKESVVHFGGPGGNCGI